LIFTLIVCTTTKNIYLRWENFSNFYTFITSDKATCYSNEHWTRKMCVHQIQKNQPPLVNKSLLTTKTSKWTNEALDEVVGVNGSKTCSLKRASRSWNKPMNSLSKHLNDKTRFFKCETSKCANK
jgi:hypothetical protein